METYWEIDELDKDTWNVFQHQQRGFEDCWQAKKFGPFRYFAVFDGHQGSHQMGSRHVAEYAASHLHRRLSHGLSRIDLSQSNIVSKTIQQIFTQFDTEMKEKDLLYGTTCTAILIDDSRKLIYQINLGDSRSLIIHNEKITSATQNHNPYNQIERSRIIQAAGLIWGKQIIKILNVSRGFGDFRLKQTRHLEYDPINGFVSSLPDVSIIPFHNAQYILLTSDAPYEGNLFTDDQLVDLFYSYHNTIMWDKITYEMVHHIIPKTTDDITIMLTSV